MRKSACLRIRRRVRRGLAIFGKVLRVTTAHVSTYEVFQFTALALGFGAILSLGPEFQTYSVALLTSQEASIYSSAYSNTLILYPSLTEWMESTWSFMYFAIALLIIVLSTRKREARTILLTGSIVSFVVLTATDWTWMIVHSGAESTPMVQNILANLIGGPIVCSILLLLMNATDSVSHASGDHALLRRCARPLIPLLLGLATMISAYYLITLFYNPTKSTVDVVLHPPVSGQFSTAELNWPPGSMESVSRDGGEAAGPFGIFSTQSPLPESLRWVGNGSSFRATWSRLSDGESDVSVSIFDGCVDGAAPTEKLGVSGITEFHKVSQLSLSVDDGTISASVGATESSGYFRMPSEPVGLYWLENGSEEGTVKLSTFVGKDAQMSYWNPYGIQRLKLSVSMFGERLGEEGRTALVDRKISLKVNGEEKVYEFFPNDQVKSNDRISCESISNHDLDLGKVALSSLVATIVLDIRPRVETLSGAIARADKDKMSISGLNGWLSADLLPPDNVGKMIAAGRVGMFSFSGGESRFTLNGEKVDVLRDQSVVLNYGQIQVASTRAGELHVTGRADAIYLNQDRLNRTRWEKLDWPIRLLIISGLQILIIWLASRLLSLVREDRVMTI